MLDTNRNVSFSAQEFLAMYIVHELASVVKPIEQAHVYSLCV